MCTSVQKETGRIKMSAWDRKEVKMKQLKNFKQFLAEEDGMGTVEVILIIVVLVGLVILFKNQITQIVNSIFSKITNQTNKI